MPFPPPDDPDDLTIPAFLRVDAAEAARRKAWWEANPPTAVNFSGQTESKRREVDEHREKLAAEKKASETKRLNELNARKKREAVAEKHGVFTQQLPGTHWDANLGRWVANHEVMSAAKYIRLLNQMPDEKHRQAFKDRFGSGPCEGTASSSTPASVVKAPAAASGKTPSPTAKSSTRPAATAAPSTASRPTHTAPATVAKPSGTRVPKEEQVAHVKAMLERPDGTTLAEAGSKFGWQEHSTSAFISVNFRNKGMATTKEKVDGRGTVYRLAK